jgi:hypothetical protein
MPNCAPEAGLPGDLQSPLSGFVALCGLCRKFGAVDRHVGEFLRHEIAPDRDDQEDHHQAEQQIKKGFNHLVTPDAR